MTVLEVNLVSNPPQTVHLIMDGADLLEPGDTDSDCYVTIGGRQWHLAIGFEKLKKTLKGWDFIRVK